MQFVRYLVSGGLAALANYGSRFVFSAWVPFETAVVLAYLLGMLIAFVLMRRFAFQGASRSTASQATWFVAINALALAQTVITSSAMLRFILPALGVHAQAEAIAHATGIAVPVLSSYLGHRWLTFR